MEKIAIAMINHKGGVGKTTLAVILSQIAMKTGAKVVAVDLDKQRNFTDAMSLVQGRYGDSLTITDKISDDGDVIILDCPPAIGDVTAQALDFSDITLVPVHPDMFSLSNLGVVYEFGKNRGKAFEQMAIVKVGFSVKNKGLTEIATDALSAREYSTAGEIALNKLIPYNIASGRVWEAGIPVPARGPYTQLYTHVLEAYKTMLLGDFKNAWRMKNNART
ncbi:MAG: ParA family protein [Holosporaceae bacterium]|jgi:cellulose biosynthesis protein BcsQ|nr:ParA family protein [Holosporaceae bacterium]